VVVLGGAAVDWVAQVETLPPRDGLVLAHAVARYPGGSAANVAVGLARLGHRVGFVGQVGDDEDGETLLQAFEQEGVDTAAVVTVADRPTAVCFIGLDAQGERIIFALPGASLIETVAELDLAYLCQGEVLYIGPAYPAVAMAAASAAREEGGTVFYAPGGAWGPAGLADMRPVLGLMDVLLVSRTEATALTGQGSPSEAARLLAQEGPPVVIETLGKEGALVLSGGRVAHCPALPVSNVRDTTGAGDAFAAGLVAGIVEGMDWEASARLGSVVAALKIQHVGARAGLPTRREVAQLGLLEAVVRGGAAVDQALGGISA